MTSPDINGILFVVVVLRKLAMPVAGGVPCVGSTFLFPRRYLKLTTCINNLHYEKFQDGTVKCIEDEIPFEVPEGWAWCKLNDIYNFIDYRGATPTKITNGIPLVTAKKCQIWIY